MTTQAVPSELKSKYPRRGDRLREEPSAKNAQGLFPPDACIFVGNLSTKVCTEDLAEDLKKVFAKFGPCHVKIKQDKKGLPGAFVQFERVEDASAALANDERVVLHDRCLRIERAKGRRTACLGLRSGAPITPRDISFALDGRGPLEAYCIESCPLGPQAWTLVSKVTFAYVDDCRDAIKDFQKDDKFYLSLLDMDGSPMLIGPEARTPFRSSGHSSVQPARNDNGYQSNHNDRPPRNRPNRYQSRGRDMRASRQNPRQRENFHPLHLRGDFPNQPIWMNSAPYNHELTHPPYPPTSLSYANDLFYSHPFIYESQPRFEPTVPPFVPAYVPNRPGEPFIINSQPLYDGNGSTTYHVPHAEENGALGPSFSYAHNQSGYPMQQTYDEPHPPKSAYIAPPCTESKPAAPSAAVENLESDSKEENVIETLLEAHIPEKAPRLIRVYDSDEERVSEASTKKADSDKAGLLEVPDNRAKEREIGIKKEEAAQNNSELQAPKLTYDSLSTTDSDKSLSRRFQRRRFDRSPDDASIRDSDSISAISRSRSRSCSSPARPADYLFSSDAPNENQSKASFKGGETIEEYVRRVVEQRGDNISEAMIQDVITSLETEQKEKDNQMAKRKTEMLVDSGSSRSRSCSLARTASSKSV